MTELRASVVICTYNRALLLACCLSSLAAAGGCDDRFEIIVVDNNSDDETATVVQRQLASMPGILYVREERQGLAHARNRGSDEARTEWLAYLDDDACVLPNYFERLAALVQAAEFDCIGGVYLPWYRDGRRRWYLDQYGSNTAVGNICGELPAGVFVSGGICLFRRAALQAVGGFRTDLGMAGRRLAYGEETRVQVLLRRLGYKIGFDSAWRVQHYTPLAKQSMRWMLRSAYARGRDSWLALDEEVDLGTVVVLLRKLVSRPLLRLAGSVGDRRLWRSWRNPALAILEPLALTLGQLAGGLRSWRYGG